MSRLRQRLIDDYAEHYARTNEFVDPRARSASYLAEYSAQFAGALASLPAGSRVLDLGCGTGSFLNWLRLQPGIQACGVDSSRSQIENLQRFLPDVEATCAEGRAYLRAHRAAFAGIYCLDVIEHIPDDELLDFLEGIREALVPGGFLFCKVPNAANIFGSYSRYIDMTHERAFTSGSLLQLLSAAGFVRGRNVPVRAARFDRRLRLQIEFLLHRGLYLLTGRGGERHFASNVCALAHRPG